MAFIPLPNGVKIEIKQRKNGAPVVNVIWGIMTIEIDSVAIADVAAAVVAWWNANVKSLMTSSLTLEEVVVTQWSVEAGLQHTEIVSPPSAGTGGTDDTPSNVAAVVTFYTGYSGRSNRGRAYMGGLNVTSTTGNTLGTTYVVGMLSAWAALKTALFAVDCIHSVASFQTDNAPRLVGVAKTITEYGMNNVVDTQRRRIPRVDN